VSCRIKYYLKDHRALRIETVVNDTYDLGILRRLEHLTELVAKARDVNRRLLDTMRVGQGCVLASPAIERIAQPTVDDGGRRAPALRFGDPRVMALTGALSLSLFAAVGVTNKSLRACVARLLGTSYSTSQMTYDLRRLRLKGLLQRIEHTHTYVLTPDGQRLAIFYTKLNNRLLRPLLTVLTDERFHIGAQVTQLTFAPSERVLDVPPFSTEFVKPGVVSGLQELPDRLELRLLCSDLGGDLIACPVGGPVRRRYRPAGGAGPRSSCGRFLR
jgi:hypothetical protein